MNQITPPPRIEIIPATAPFSEGQRSWLNGFLAGMLSLDGSTFAPVRSFGYDARGFHTLTLTSTSGRTGRLKHLAAKATAYTGFHQLKVKVWLSSRI